MSTEIESIGTIAILGCGNMGGAILGGLCRANAKVIACDNSEEKLNSFKQQYQIEVTTSLTEACKKADILIIAVKPNAIAGVLDSIKGSLKDNCHIISVAAGVMTESFLKAIPNCNISRVMPNLPAVVGKGMSAIYSKNLKNSEVCEYIFSQIGQTIIVAKESDLNTATAIAGSAPAFFALVIESLTDAGIVLGLSKQESLKMVIQTALGTAELLQSNKIEPSKFIEMVSSPGGTTLEGLRILEEKGVRRIFVDAAKSASSRAKALSKENY